MSFNSSMLIANNGLNVHAKAIKVTSHNVANVSTTAFRASLCAAKDLVSSNTGGASGIINGQGATLGRIYQSFDTRGSTQTTGVNTHLALQSDGFFIVQGKYNGQSGQYFTRDGTFSQDKDGKLVTQEGLVLQGYPYDVNGVTGSRVTDLVVPANSLSAPEASDRLDVIANVDGRKPAVTFSATNPSGTSEKQFNFDIYDSLGSKHAVTAYLTPSGGGTPTGVGAVAQPISYDYNILANPDELVGAAPVSPVIGTGKLFFDNTGKLQAINSWGATTATATASFKMAKPNQAITLNLGDPLSAGGSATGVAGLTAYGDGSSISKVNPNGYPQGLLRNISIDQQGVITGAFSTGDRRELGQVATARFACNQELEAVGHNLFSDTPRSGLPIISGGTATIEAGALEQSNVDLGEELIKALGYERGYQVNARTIQTINSMYAELINIGR